MSIWKRKKRIVLVNRDFQMRYTKAAVVVGVFSTILTIVVILYPLYVFEILRIPNFLPTRILSMMLLAVLINVGALYLFGILMTHRIAGPMYALVKHIRLVGMGKWNSLMHLRADDDLRYVVRNFNEMVGSLTEITKGDIKRLEAIDEMVSSNLDEDKIKNLKEQISELKSDLEKRYAPS